MRTIRDGEPRTATSTFTQFLSSDGSDDRVSLLFLKMADTQKLPKVPETFLRRIVMGGPRQKLIFAIINRQL